MGSCLAVLREELLTLHCGGCRSDQQLLTSLELTLIKMDRLDDKTQNPLPFRYSASETEPPSGGGRKGIPEQPSGGYGSNPESGRRAADAKAGPPLLARTYPTIGRRVLSSSQYLAHLEERANRRPRYSS